MIFFISCWGQEEYIPRPAGLKTDARKNKDRERSGGGGVSVFFWRRANEGAVAYYFHKSIIFIARGVRPSPIGSRDAVRTSSLLPITADGSPHEAGAPLY
ncbi:hypothetical protein WA026_000694 [Henosepilachna vigintioctopunctata]|uniref:Uncharacterized protein n=1 Tax=Henosepilachna vigintioctopunctata TaxID=420089 RepID=A0AAW1UYG2_9CUCU